MKPETKVKEMSAGELAAMLRKAASLLEEETDYHLKVTLTRGKSYMKIRGIDAGGGISFTISNGRAAV
jgi:acyl-CoA reductase-like NAD-dependent aldehyde dehydrogenase